MQKNTKDLSSKQSNIKETIEVKKGKSQIDSKKAVDSSTKKSRSTSAKKTTTKKTSTKVSEPKKPAAKKTAKKKAVTKKAVAPKTATKKVKTSTKAQKKSTKKKTSNGVSKSKKAEIIEYYDLPYRYNQTVVKILAQTPNTLFVYWDISDKDREKYINQFGEDFFNTTVPVLIVHNKTMNYSFEIEINDFANSWYFNINDPKCDYEIELGRRAKPNTYINLPNNYMYVTSSNVIESPNNHILFEKNQKVLFFRNIKNNVTYSKDISEFNFMEYMGRVYNIYDIYRKIYNTEELKNIENNPSSSFNKGEF